MGENYQPLSDEEREEIFRLMERKGAKIIARFMQQRDALQEKLENDLQLMEDRYNNQVAARRTKHDDELLKLSSRLNDLEAREYSAARAKVLAKRRRA